MPSRIVSWAVEAAEQYGPSAFRTTPARAAEAAIDFLRRGDGRSTGPHGAAARILNAWLVTDEARERYLREPRLNNAISLLANLAEQAVFDDMPLSERERNQRMSALDDAASFLAGVTEPPHPQPLIHVLRDHEEGGDAEG